MPKNDFELYYSKLFGNRWPQLKEALLAVALPVEFCDGLIKPYHLDKASVVAGLALQIPDSGEILDACAAPGGKSLVILSKMNDKHKLLSNELSQDRCRRLKNVLDEHLSNEKRKLVTVSSFDAASQGSRRSEHKRFSAILLDTPCSSERHVISDEKALSEWTPSRIKFLARRQWSLLSSMFLLLKEGGSLVYSTCALNPSENDDVISRLYKKYDGCFELQPLEDSEFLGLTPERTQFGVHFMPDSGNGEGPLYVARIKKTANNKNY